MSSVYDDDEELPSYETCISEFVEELDSSTPPESLHELGATELTQSPPAPPAVPIHTKPDSNNSPGVEPISGPPPIRRETRPENTNVDASAQQPNNSVYYSTSQADQPTSKPYGYSSFLIDGLHPSDTFCRLAEALFRQLTPSEFVDPLALARADDPNIRNVELTPRMLFRLTRYLTLAGIPFTRTVSGIPVLTRDSFIHSLVFELRANPEYSHAIWQIRFRHYTLYDTHTHLNFTPLPRAAFPERAVDAVLTNVHDVWRAIIHVLGKRQGKAYMRNPRYGDEAVGRPPQSDGTLDANLTFEAKRLAGHISSEHGRGDTLVTSERKCARGFKRGVGRGIAKGLIRSIL